jgi:hypothetical protein
MIESKLMSGLVPACLLSTALLVGCADGGGSDAMGAAQDNQITTQLSADPLETGLELGSSTGTSVLTVDPDTGAISGNITIAGLSSPARLAHIHNALAGSVGPVLIALNIDEEGSKFSVPLNAALDASGIDNYLNGELYIDVHTDDYPAGEIREQLVPVDADGRTRFSVQVSNVSTDTTLTTPSTGGAVAVPLSPGAYIVHNKNSNPFVQAGSASDEALEALAENGNPSFLQADIPGSGVFNTPDNAFIPRSIYSGESYTFTVTAEPGDKLSLLTMFAESNDWFYSTHSSDNGILLFDEDGAPISGDVTSNLSLWESDTEEDQEPGVGLAQAPRQGDSGDIGITTENGVVASLAEKGKLDSLQSVLNSGVIRVTITPLP